MSEWKEFKLGELCNIRRGASPRPINDYLSEQGMPWVKISDATSENSRFIKKTVQKIKLSGVQKSLKVNPGDFILSNSATPGIPKLMNIEACIHDGWLLLSNFNKIDKLFLYYFLLHERPSLANQGNGSVFTNLKTDIVKNLRITIPDLPTQTAIAEILSSLDDKIELNNKINRELENLAQTLFKQWFIEFEFPNENGELYKSSGGEMVDSELGEIPKEWEVTKISTLDYILQTGTRPKGGVGGIRSGVPSIGAESIKGLGYYDFSKIKYVSNEFASKMKRGKVDGYELLIYKDGGKPGTFIPHFSMFGEGFPFETFFINEHVFLLDFFDKAFNSFCYFYFDSEYVKPVFENNGGKAAIPGINQEDVKNLLIFRPDNEIVKVFGEFAKSSITTILKNCKENIQLINLRDELLPKLISGELDINETNN
jgi:type I restriction enzyme S subunit